MENENEDVLLFGKGAIREDIPDPRDFQWGRDVGMGSPPFDWDKGYDVEEELSNLLGTPFSITVKDQNGSSSCGGQAWSYLGQVLNVFHDKNTKERSAKFIYSQTYVGTGGSGGRENSSIAIKQGWGLEEDTPSYENGLPPSEGFMEKTMDITPIAKEHAKIDKAFSYANVVHVPDLVAQAMRDNHGCIIGLTGSQNGTWRSEFPLPPATFNGTWSHWLYVGKCKIINDKKYFAVLNSWGMSTGKKGWQWIAEDYFTIKILEYPVIWSIWTMAEAQDIIPPVLPLYIFTKTLRLGSTGVDVMQLQIKLGIKVDGKFGLDTLHAVQAFQTANGLIADGIVGKNTNKYLNL